jgi:hypothetical protein
MEELCFIPNTYNTSAPFWTNTMGQIVVLLGNILGAYSWIHIGWVRLSFLTLFVTTFGLDFYKSLGICLLFVLINLGFMLHITSDKQLINWWKKRIDFVEIEFHLNENIEWHWMQLESKRIQILKFNSIQFNNWIKILFS